MRERTMSFLRQTYPVATLLVLVLLLFLTNFQPGTWLSGWDNLHPEFYFTLNLKRSLFAVWQEYQGLGLLGGMGHASDLPRQILLWLFSTVIPSQYLRYFYHFGMLLTGAIGLYFLLRDIVFENSKDPVKKIASLVGAIFYLLNLATLQVFYVPFEPYSAHFAFLPWLLWVNVKFLKEGSKKALFLLTLINLLSLTQAYVPTFFFVYLISLGFVFLFYLNKLIQIKRIFLAFLITFVINAFWLLPNLYFIADGTDINLNSKINQMATEDNLLKNKKFGSLADTMLLKGFWFDGVEINGEGISEYQFKDWLAYLNKPLVKAIGYLLFVISMLGILSAIIQKNRRPLIFLPSFLLSFIVISSNTSILSSLADLFFKIPLFSQAFRFSFMKFSVTCAFCLSIFYGFSYFSLARIIKKNFYQYLLALVFITLPIIFMLPIFQGKLFYNKEKANIPQEYFQVMDFFRSQNPNTRIADFPQSSFWGWYFYQFNYSGSGFIWYGIEQPILDRTFDPWSNFNENYYWEITYALYSRNQNLFEKTLEKYQINWILIDENIISPSSAKSLFYDELEEILASSTKVTPAQTFGKIKIYQVNLETPVNNFVFLAENLPAVSPSYKWNNFDQAYLENGNYITNPLIINHQSSIYYPFRSLFTGRSQSDLEFVVENRGDSFVFKKTIPQEFKDYVLVVPQTESKELPRVDPQDLGLIEYLKPDIFLDGLNLEVKVPKVGGYWSAEIKPVNEPSVRQANNCNQFSQGEVKNEVIENEWLRLSSLNALNCSASFWLPDLPHNLAYLITAESRNIVGKPLLFWLENLNIRKADIETYLPKNSKLEISNFIQPPMESDGLGYTLHFDNNSIGQEKTINDLGKITVNPIPFKFLTELKLIDPASQQTQSQILPVNDVSHPNPSLYEIHQSLITNHQSPILVLSQSYHEGWRAYVVNKNIPSIIAPFFGQKVGEHILVNNWENGWKLEQTPNENEKIVILFLPQYLEYLGLFLLLLTILPLYLLTKTETSIL